MASDSAGFESYCEGSWWEVQIDAERSRMFHLSFTADEDKERPWVPLTELRLSSRRADVWDCSTIRKGMDVAVLAKHPHTKSLNLKKEGLYDARVSAVARSIHAPECSCKFSISFFNVELDTCTDGTHGNLLDRILLTDEPEIEVSISDIRILQKPAENIPLRQVLDAHLGRRWIPLGRACQDSYFLTETELSTTSLEREAFLQDDADRAHVRSAEVLAPSPEGLSEKNRERASNFNPPQDGPQLDVHASRETIGTAGEDRAPKSAPAAPENHRQKGAAAHQHRTKPELFSIKRESFSSDHDRSNGVVREGPPVKKAGRPKQEHLKTKQKANARVMVEDTVIECTQLSSDTSDAETEWKPVPGAKKLPLMRSSIRTRDKAIDRKDKFKEKRRPSLRSATRSGTRDTSACSAGINSRRKFD